MTTTASNLPRKFVSRLASQPFIGTGCKFFTEIKSENTRRTVSRFWWETAELAKVHADKFNATKTNPDLFAVAFEAQHVLIPNA